MRYCRSASEGMLSERDGLLEPSTLTLHLCESCKVSRPGRRSMQRTRAENYSNGGNQSFVEPEPSGRCLMSNRYDSALLDGNHVQANVVEQL